MQQALGAFLSQGIDESEQPVTELLKLAMRRVIQEALEQEVADSLGRDRYARRQAEQVGLRNGYEPGRIRSAEGEVELQVPQVRGTETPYRSRLMDFLRGNSDVLEHLVVEMYTRGLSTRDIEEAFRDPLTGQALLGHAAVSELTDSLWEEYQAFCQRDLSGFEVEYVFLDAVYESLRQQGHLKEALLVGWAICRDGRKVLLHMALGNKESLPAWRDFIHHMTGRGLRVPTLVTTDGSPAVVAAVEDVWPRSLRQRCLAHKKRNALDKVPDNAQAEVKRALSAIYEASSREIADLLAADFIQRYGQVYPSAVTCFQDDLEACLSFLRCPAIHHKRIRTTNLLERAFVEERRRTRTIPRFFDERSCLKLVFATLWQASERWQSVRMSEFECQQLDHLRRELGLLTTEPATRSVSLEAAA
jgi:transposase-like protein